MASLPLIAFLHGIVHAGLLIGYARGKLRYGMLVVAGSGVGLGIFLFAFQVAELPFSEAKLMLSTFTGFYGYGWCARSFRMAGIGAAVGALVGAVAWLFREHLNRPGEWLLPAVQIVAQVGVYWLGYHLARKRFTTPDTVKGGND